MSKKPKQVPPIKPLPNGEVPAYTVTGVTPEQKAYVKAHISDMAPNNYPDQIAFLPSDQYRRIADEISKHGTFGGVLIGKGPNSQENFGLHGTASIGDAFSMPSTQRIYLDAKLLDEKHSDALKKSLAHEFGHFSATSKDQSEDAADKWKDDVYLPRAKAQEQLTKQVADLPSRTLGSALPPVEPLAPATQYLGSALPQNTPAAQPIPEMTKPDTAAQSAAEEATARGKALSRR